MQNNKTTDNKIITTRPNPKAFVHEGDVGVSAAEGVLAFKVVIAVVMVLYVYLFSKEINTFS